MATSPHKPTAAEAFARLAEIIRRLRAPDGCPWDREQTHQSLRSHLLEEACEAMQAIEQQDAPHLCEELGDLLMQPLLHAEIAREAGEFDIVDVLEGISEKLVRRHPHVFGELQLGDSTAVLRQWEAIKHSEKAGKAAASVLDEVPPSLPALALALKVSRKAAREGFEWPDLREVLAKLREELEELEEVLGETRQTRPASGNISDTPRAVATTTAVAGELGDLLFTAVNVARWCGINPELALRDMVERFARRFRVMEAAAQEQQIPLQALSPEQWELLWEQAKTNESAEPQ